MCDHCASNGYVPTEFDGVVPCPRCSPDPNKPPRYNAYVGTEHVHGDDDLSTLLDWLTDVFEPGHGEDLVVWEEGRRLICVFLDNDRVWWPGRTSAPRRTTVDLGRNPPF
jgi:hypothetical protein